jgi:hypothetical protein
MRGFLKPQSSIANAGSFEPGSLNRIAKMLDGLMGVALFAAFLLGMVAGSGLEILVRQGRQ